ncbi:MAG: NUDIX hydrolase [Nanoarchaeota archaeon]|nr:NUDIX hydrolase [Nanoarchaeota archaeon]
MKPVVSVILPWENGFVYVKTKKDAKYGLPGGKINLFESLDAAAPRELSEEIGCEAVLDHFIGLWFFKSDRGSSVINMVYGGRIIEGTPHIKKPKEIEQIIYPKLSEVREMYREGKIRSNLANVTPLEKYLAGIAFPLNIVDCFFVR